MSAEEKPAETHTTLEEPTQEKITAKQRIQAWYATYRHTYQKLPRRTVVMLLIALVTLIAGSSILGYTTIYQPHMVKVQSTATANALANATAIADATSNAHVQATITSQAVATNVALRNLQAKYEQITQKNPTLTDDLQQPGLNNWDTGSGCEFTNKTYSATVTQKGYFIPCFAKNTKFSNFAYQVRMKFIKGDGGGIIFRANASKTESYLFIIRRDGSYNVYYYPGDSKKKTQTLIEGYSDLIATASTEENLITVIARQQMFDFYINNTYIASMKDSHLTSGQIGVIAHDVNSNTEVRYLQAQVWKLS